MKNVLIIGAGPVGLSAALALSKMGIEVRIIEKRESGAVDKTKAKAITLSTRSLEFLDAIGLKEQYVENGHVCRGYSRFVGKHAVKKSDYNTLDESYTESPYFLHLPQWKMEEIILEELNRIGVNIEWGTAFQAFHDTDAVINKNGKEEYVKAEYFLGCDGPKSIVRESLGIKLNVEVDPFLSFHQLDARIDLFKGDLSHRYFYLLNDKLLIVLPLYGQFQRIVICRIKKDNSKKVTLETFNEALQEAGYRNATIQDPIWFTEFDPTSSIVEKFRDGPIFLLGDAAHPISPITGQGVNTGFQDVYNLSWKLALVLKKKIDPGFLDSYHTERYYAGCQLVARASRLSHFYKDCMQKGIRWYFNRMIFMRKRFLSTYLIEQSQIELSYPSKKGKKDNSKIQPGMRLPDFQVSTASGPKAIFKMTSYDRYLLIALSAQEPYTIIPEIKNFRDNVQAKYGDLLHCICIVSSTISPSGFNNNQGWPDYVCIDFEHIQDKFDIKTPCYILVRPDNYVADIGTFDDFTLDFFRN